MSEGPANPSPLPEVLADLALTDRHLVLIRGREYYRVDDAAKQARRDAASGPPDVRRFLSDYSFWWEKDPDGKIIIMQRTLDGPRVFAAEVGSSFVSWTLDKGERGPQTMLSGSLGRRDRCKGAVFERNCYETGAYYSFDDLPAVAQKDIRRQRDDFEMNFGRQPETLDFRFLVVPHADLLRVLRDRFGEDLDKELRSEGVKKIAHSIEREGLRSPPVAGEGWKRAMALASLGLEMPYFEPIAPFELMPEQAIPSLEGRRRVKDPQYKQLREGFWRMIQRIHSGIPGYAGTGFVSGGQFTGGNAGIRTAWVLKPNRTMNMIDAVPVAGFYSFGALWPQMLGVMGLSGDFSKMTRELDEEFGIASTIDLTRGTVPNPEA